MQDKSNITPSKRMNMSQPKSTDQKWVEAAEIKQK